MKTDNHDDDDGFEEATIEIHTELLKQQITPYIGNIKLPEANPLYVSDGLDQFDENCQRQNQNSLTDLSSQTLYERLEKGVTPVYKKFSFIETSTVTTGVFKSIEWWKQQKEQLFKQQKRQTLSFDSNFPTGNLWAVYQNNESNVYELLLQNDSSTNGYTQWFNFRISEIPPQTILVIKIINLLKDYSHFDNGMVPLILKNQNTSEPITGAWIYNVQYYRNSIVHQELRRDGSTKQRKYHTLEFTFESGDKFIDYAFISMNQPYSYERLCQFLYSQRIQSTVITKTLLGYDCMNFRLGTPQKKKVVVLARQHPGETVSSFVLEGVIKFLNQSQKLEAQWLLQQAEFTIVPMVNVDGTQLGNFRCNPLGQDVNRIWNNPRKNSEIYALKQLLLENPTDFFIDLHGHSKKMNTFIYGCRNEQDPISCRVYPKIMERICPYFSFQDCTYSINKDKVKTARAIVFNAQQSLAPNSQHNVFTLETSSFGYTSDKTLNAKKIQFSIEQLHSIGESLMMGIFYYWGGLKDPLFKKQDQKDCIDPNDIEKDLINIGFQDNQNQDSDSDAEIDLLPLKKQQTIEEQNEEDEEKLRPKSPKKKMRLGQKQKLSIIQKKSAFKPTQLHVQLLNGKVLDQQGQKKTYEKQQNSIQLSHLSRPTSPRKNETLMATYFSKHRSNGSQQQEGLRPHKVSLYTHQQSLSNQDMQVQGEPLQQLKYSSYRNPVGTPKETTMVLKPLDHARMALIHEKVSDLPPTFSNAQQTLRRQLQGMIFEQKKEDRQKTREEYTRKDTRRKNILQNNATSSQAEKQIPQPTAERKIRIKHRQESINQGKTAVLSGEDVYMSQLLRDIWKMNQLKYGQQLLQPKHIKLFTPTEETEECKIFDDKKLQKTKDFNIRNIIGQTTKQNFTRDFNISLKD